MILTVPYITTDYHKKLAIASYKSFPKDVRKIAVENQVRMEDWEDIGLCNDFVMVNDVNCLAGAWNMGLKAAFIQGADYVFIPNLDVLWKPNTYEKMLQYIEENKDAGLWAMTAINDLTHFTMREDAGKGSEPIKIHDQSFSSFVISKELYEDVGEFDEQFEPAYYEDCDYLHRCHLKGWLPMRSNEVIFYHEVQGVMKNTTKEHQEEYPAWIKALEQKYINKWGGKPGDERKDTLTS